MTSDLFKQAYLANTGGKGSVRIKTTRLGYCFCSAGWIAWLLPKAYFEMIDFKSVLVELNNIRAQDISERLLAGHRNNVPFKQSGALSGAAAIQFTRGVIRAEAAIKSFHFETEGDHNMKKIKLEPRVTVNGSTVNVFVEGVFMDSSPDDDFFNKRFIMSAEILVIAEYHDRGTGTSIQPTR